MARLELRLDGAQAGVAVVTLSRRNLLTLLHKLDMRGSARTITNGYCYFNSELSDELTLVLRAEDDESHYGERAEPPGAVHPASEAHERDDRAIRVRLWNGDLVRLRKSDASSMHLHNLGREMETQPHPIGPTRYERLREGLWVVDEARA